MEEGERMSNRKTWPRYRVPGAGVRNRFNGLGAYERALKRGREIAALIREPVEILELDQHGNETPVATVGQKYRRVHNPWNRSADINPFDY